MRFVRNALRFGFSVKQIAAFLGARDAGTPPCLNVLAAAEQLRSAMDRQIEDLTAARAAIERTLREWDKRLASTPRGKPARLLETLPDAHGGRHRVRPRPA